MPAFVRRVCFDQVVILKEFGLMPLFWQKCEMNTVVYTWKQLLITEW